MSDLNDRSATFPVGWHVRSIGGLALGEVGIVLRHDDEAGCIVQFSNHRFYKYYNLLTPAMDEELMMDEGF